MSRRAKKKKGGLDLGSFGGGRAAAKPPKAKTLSWRLPPEASSARSTRRLSGPSRARLSGPRGSSGYPEWDGRSASGGASSGPRSGRSMSGPGARRTARSTECWSWRTFPGQA